MLHREVFRDSIWAFETPSGDRHWFAFVFAVQRPYLVCLLPLHVQSTFFEPEIVCSASFEGLARRAARLTFAVRFEGIIFDCRFDFEYTRIWVAQHLLFVDRNIAVCNSEAVPLNDVLRSFLEAPAPEQKDVAAKNHSQPSEAAALLLTQHPWLAAHALPSDAVGSEDTASVGRPTMGDAGDSRAVQPEEQQEEDIMQGVFAELTAKRAEVLDQEVSRLAFPVRLLGGAWAAKNRGVACDAFSAAASSAEVRSFCTSYRLPKSARFDISAYGDSGASLMCHAWSRRMCHFWGLARVGGPGHKFQPEDLLVDLGAEFEAYAGGLEGRARSRAQQIRDLAPTNP